MLVEDRGGGLVSASYGEDDISRVEDPEKIKFEDEESGESSRNSVSNINISYHSHSVAKPFGGDRS